MSMREECENQSVFLFPRTPHWFNKWGERLWLFSMALSRIVMTAKTAGWKPVPRLIAHRSILIAQYSLLISECGTVFQLKP